MTRLLHVDATAGIAGDMFLAALLDAGAAERAVRDAIAAVNSSIMLGVSSVTNGGLAACRVQVSAPEQDSSSWAEIRELLTEAELPSAVKAQSLEVFEGLAIAEGKVHGVATDAVHFHEVGAWDSLADIVGCAAALESLDVSRVVVSEVALGRGSVNTEHGVLPVPPPAVAELLIAAGAPVVSGPADFESCTPTGAALIGSLASEFGGVPDMRLLAQGVGAGSVEPDGRSNVTRVLLGDTTAAGASSAATRLIETNVDDMDPRLWPGTLQRLLEVGAFDAWLTPILMKKGRPAHTLSVLTPAATVEAVVRLIFSETSAIGVRELTPDKHAADRTFASVKVRGQEVSVKVASYGGLVVNRQPEWEDVAGVAAELGLPPAEVLREAVAAVEADL